MSTIQVTFDHNDTKDGNVVQSTQDRNEGC